MKIGEFEQSEFGCFSELNGESKGAAMEDLIEDCLCVSGLQSHRVITTAPTLEHSLVYALLDEPELAKLYFISDSEPIFAYAHCSKEEEEKAYKQVYAYMHDLRYNFGIRDVFGIVCAGDDWRFLWFADIDRVARASNKKAYQELPKELDEQNTRLCVTRIYNRSETNFIPSLATLIYKAATSPEIPLTMSMHPFTTENWFVYADPPSELQYQMPPADVKRFFILHCYPRGRDGKVALCCSEKGHLGVLKFLHVPSDETLQREADNWFAVWKLRPRIVTVSGRCALLMPFAFVYDETDKCWVDHDDRLHAGNRNFDSEAIAKYLSHPEVALEEALNEMVKIRGYKHNDLEWRHVALIQDPSQARRLKPILIDLSDVASLLPNEDPDEYVGLQLHRLQLTKP